MSALEMLQRLRTLLDEKLSQFWDDGLDCYPALTDAQTEYAAIILLQWKARSIVNPSELIPETLLELYVKSSGNIAGQNYILRPSNYLYDLSIYLGSPYSRNLLRREVSKASKFETANIYIGTQGYFYSVKNDRFDLEIPVPTGPSGIDYILEYLKKTTTINANTNPILPEFTHQAIVVFAFATLLKKAKLIQESNAQFQEFASLVKYI